MSVIQVSDFFNYITFLNKTFETPEKRVHRLNGSYKYLLDSFFTEGRFEGNPLIYRLLVEYRERQLNIYGKKRHAG